jgi:hypothetical protein
MTQRGKNVHPCCMQQCCLMPHAAALPKAHASCLHTLKDINQRHMHHICGTWTTLTDATCITSAALWTILPSHVHQVCGTLSGITDAIYFTACWITLTDGVGITPVPRWILIDDVYIKPAAPCMILTSAIWITSAALWVAVANTLPCSTFLRHVGTVRSDASCTICAACRRGLDAARCCKVHSTNWEASGYCVPQYYCWRHVTNWISTLTEIAIYCHTTPRTVILATFINNETSLKANSIKITSLYSLPAQKIFLHNIRRPFAFSTLLLLSTLSVIQ